MKKMMIAIIFLSLFLGNHQLGASSLTVETRSTWLWNTSMIVNNGEEVLSFLESKQINKVYLQIDKNISNEVYQRFIENASGKGIAVYALDGAPNWVAKKGSNYQDQFLNWVGNYQNVSGPTQTFAGIHLDVEPYLYSGWTSNQASVIKSYQSLLTKAKQTAMSLNLPLEVDIPFWFDGITYKNHTYGKGILAEWVIATTDGVTIMAYRDTAEQIIDIVSKEIQLAAKYGKSLVIGVETKSTSEGDNITFYEEGEAYMNQQLATVQDHYNGHEGFGGIAIHHVGSWMNMQP